MLDLVPHVNARELAQMLGITTQSVWGLVRRGTICPPILIKHRHVWHADTAAGIVRYRSEPREKNQDTTHRRRRGIQLTVWVPPELKEALQGVAKKNGTTLTAAVCAAIQSWWVVCGSQTTPGVCLGKDERLKS